MKKSALIVALLLGATLAASAAERRRGLEMPQGRSVSPQANAGPEARAGARAAASTGGVRQADTLAQAPVLLQVYRLGPMAAAYAQTVASLPAGTALTLFLITPDQKQIRNTTWVYDEAIPNERWLPLPDIREFGPLATEGIYTWDLWVETPDGTTSHCKTDFTVRHYRTPDEIAQVVPLIRSARVERADGRATLVVSGVFTSDKPLALLEDWSVPSAAITSWNSSEIRIDLGAIPNFPANDLDDYMLTIGQGGVSNTLPVRVTP